MSRSLPGSLPSDRSRKRRLAVAVATLAVSSIGLSSALTGALFTDSETITSNTFVTGNVALTASPASGAVAVAAIPGMAPGDQVVAPITVTNTGSLQLRYALRSTSDALDANTLAAALQMTVKFGFTAATCTAANFVAGGTSTLYGPGVLGTTAGQAVFGSSVVGPQAGDRVLNAGANEVLCVRVQLPIAVTSTLASKTTTATFTFDAEQTANNP